MFLILVWQRPWKILKNIFLKISLENILGRINPFDPNLIVCNWEIKQLSSPIWGLYHHHHQEEERDEKGVVHKWCQAILDNF